MLTLSRKVFINLVGDGNNTSFKFPVAIVYNSSLFPDSIQINNPPVAVLTATIDNFGNITVVFVDPPFAGQEVLLAIDLQHHDGSKLSTSATPTVSINTDYGTF